MSIIARQVSYLHPNKEILFQNINFTILKGEKIALVAKNGVGKSTLLRIISDKIQDFKGKIISSEKLYYISQHFGQYDNLSIAEVLNVNLKIKALREISKGNVNEENINDLDDDWNIEEKIQLAFEYWNLKHLDLSQKINSLSGGEKTKVFLSGISIHEPSIILFDEPSNHLDLESRNILYDFIIESKSTMIIVSHDRTLLNLLDKIFELTKSGIEIYGGNYEFYKIQKDNKIRSLQSEKKKI